MIYTYNQANRKDTHYDIGNGIEISRFRYGTKNLIFTTRVWKIRL